LGGCRRTRTVLIFLGFVVGQVRSAKTDMVVRIFGKLCEIRRGKADPPATSTQPPQQRSIESAECDNSPSRRPG
jgi:hypothetical protein